jgi:5-enolpyruvylshikimate-3-phosphate synthase
MLASGLPGVVILGLAALGVEPRAGARIVIENPACVAKTFPEYFDELEKLTLRAAPPT